MMIETATCERCGTRAFYDPTGDALFLPDDLADIGWIKSGSEWWCLECTPEDEPHPSLTAGERTDASKL